MFMLYPKVGVTLGEKLRKVVCEFKQRNKPTSVGFLLG